MSEVDLFSYQQNLMERICSLEELGSAFQAVKRNGGAPGIDGVTVKEFEERLPQELRQLKKDLEGWTYEPSPVRRVEIPKPGVGAGVRLLGIPTVRDRVLHAAIKAVLEPIFDPLFSEHSYGFRPKRNQQQAVLEAQRLVQSGKEHVVDIDLAQFFDRIHHDRLIHRLGLTIQDKQVLRLIGLTLTRFIEKRLKLVVNREKSKVALSKGVKFLGMTIVAGAIAISAKSMARAMDKVRDLTRRGTSMSIEQTVESINSWYVGWASYYKMTQYPSQLAEIEAHLRRRLRARIVSQQKKRRHLFEKLQERGVPGGLAAKDVYSNKGRWALSLSGSMHRAYPNRWFIQELGQEIVSDEHHPHWFPLKIWIRLS